MKSFLRFYCSFFLLVIFTLCYAQGLLETPISGTVVDPQGKPVPNAVVKVTDGLGRMKLKTIADAEGKFALKVLGSGTYALVAEASGFDAITSGLTEMKGDAQTIELKFGSLAKAETVLTVTEKVLEPTVDQKDAAVFTKTLFTRDDQVFQSLGSGLSLGQHAGGGKSLEVRRFGFNLDHGGTGGGVRVVMDDLLVNQVSGGHAHGYLGALKGLSPELVQEVNLINGPFNAQYGEFSGLGVINIKTREEMPDTLTGRVQFGQFNTRRIFGAYSPTWDKTSAVFANEYSYSDGPFTRPLNYTRNNTTLGLFRNLRPGLKVGGRLVNNYNDFFSAGQLPVDLIESGQLDRYGNIDPTEGGTSKQTTLSLFLNKERANGDVFKMNGMVQRLLFDLYSNFTFFEVDPVNGDAFGQHDSRLQQEFNTSYTKQHQLFGGFGTLTGGANLLANQLNLKLYGRDGRVPTDIRTWANADILNIAPFVQENLVFFQGKLTLGGGIRYDLFDFRADNRIVPNDRIVKTGGLWQPKFSLSYTPSKDIPLSLYLNYGRAVTSSNARAILQDPSNTVLVAKTDFYQFGTATNKGRFSVATNFFWIDRSNEMLYVADDGSNELVGPSRSYGFEVKTSTSINRYLSVNASLTKVLNAFYRGTGPREYVDRAPHFTAYVGVTLNQWKGWNGSLRFRSINHFRVNRDELPSLTAPGHTVTDVSLSRKLYKGIELNFAIDNIFDKTYYETVDYYASRLKGQPSIERFHATPGYPITFIGGITFRLWNKNGG